MIDISGHLHKIKNEQGYGDFSKDLSINCCGYQKFYTQDFSKSRPEGRLDYQLIYIHKGKGHFYLNGTWTTFQEGSVILFSPTEPQIYQYFAKEKPEVYWLHFTGSKCMEYLLQYQIKTGYVAPLLFAPSLFQEIMLELQLQKPCFEDIICQDFFKLLCLINRECKIGYTQTPIHENIDRLILKLHQEYAHNWTIKEMADFCNLSVDYFSHLFKALKKQPPLQFLTQIRVEKAKELLLIDTMTISSVADLTGFRDPLYFSRTFKKYTKSSPSHYRTNLLEL